MVVGACRVCHRGERVPAADIGTPVVNYQRRSKRELCKKQVPKNERHLSQEEGDDHAPIRHPQQARWYCQVDEKLVDLPPRYSARSRREPAMLGIETAVSLNLTIPSIDLAHVPQIGLPDPMRPARTRPADLVVAGERLPHVGPHRLQRSHKLVERSAALLRGEAIGGRQIEGFLRGHVHVRGGRQRRHHGGASHGCRESL